MGGIYVLLLALSSSSTTCHSRVSIRGSQVLSSWTSGCLTSRETIPLWPSTNLRQLESRSDLLDGQFWADNIYLPDMQKKFTDNNLRYLAVCLESNGVATRRFSYKLPERFCPSSLRELTLFHLPPVPSPFTFHGGLVGFKELDETPIQVLRFFGR